MLLSVLRGEKKGKKLISYGVPEGQLNDSVIPESDWSLLEPWNSPLGSIGAKTRSGVRPYRRYDTIILSADDVMRVWPAEGPQQESVTAEEAPPTTVAAIRRATEALANELNGNPDMKKLPDARDFCRQRGVSQRQFLRTIWKDAREKAGLDPKGRPGPKRKPKSNAVCSD